MPDLAAQPLTTHPTAAEDSAYSDSEHNALLDMPLPSRQRINYALLRLETLLELRALVEIEGPSFDYTNTTNALQRLSVLMRAYKRQLKAAGLLTPAAEAHAAQEYTQPCLALLTPHLRSRQDQLDARGVASCLLSCSALDHYDRALFDMLCARGEALINHFKPVDCVNVVVAFARFGHYHPGLLANIPQALLTHMYEVQPFELSQVLWGFGKLKVIGTPTRAFLRAACEVITDSMHLFGNQELSNVMWGLVQLGHYPGTQLLQRCEAVMQHRLRNTLQLRPPLRRQAPGSGLHSAQHAQQASHTETAQVHTAQHPQAQASSRKSRHADSVGVHVHSLLRVQSAPGPIQQTGSQTQQQDQQQQATPSTTTSSESRAPWQPQHAQAPVPWQIQGAELQGQQHHPLPTSTPAWFTNTGPNAQQQHHFQQQKQQQQQQQHSQLQQHLYQQESHRLGSPRSNGHSLADTLRPLDISNVLWAFGRLRYKAVGLLDELPLGLGPWLPSFGVSELCGLLVGYAHARHYHRGVLDAVPHFLMPSLPHMGPTELLSCLWAYSVFQHRPAGCPQFLPGLCACLVRYMRGLRPQAHAMIAKACANLQYRPDVLLHEVVRGANARVTEFRPDEMASLLYGLSYLAGRPPHCDLPLSAQGGSSSTVFLSQEQQQQYQQTASMTGVGSSSSGAGSPAMLSPEGMQLFYAVVRRCMQLLDEPTHQYGNRKHLHYQVLNSIVLSCLRVGYTPWILIDFSESKGIRLVQPHAGMLANMSTVVADTAGAPNQQQPPQPPAASVTLPGQAVSGHHADLPDSFNYKGRPIRVMHVDQRRAPQHPLTEQVGPALTVPGAGVPEGFRRRLFGKQQSSGQQNESAAGSQGSMEQVVLQEQAGMHVDTQQLPPQQHEQVYPQQQQQQESEQYSVTSNLRGQPGQGESEVGSELSRGVPQLGVVADATVSAMRALQDRPVTGSALGFS